MRRNISSKISSLLRTQARKFSISSSSSSSEASNHHAAKAPAKPRLNSLCYGRNSTADLALRYLSIAPSGDTIDDQSNDGNHIIDYDTNEEVEPIDSWEEEEEVEPEIGDGGDGGGVVFRNCAWGEQALTIAHEVLKEHTVDMELFAFKTSPQGYVYVRLDKLTNEYGCPSMDEIENFSHEYKKKLDEAGATGKLPEDLALEVSSPGAERLLKVPDDLNRFKHIPMRVSYVESEDSRAPETTKIFFLESIDTDSRSCIWKLVDVKENRDPSSKGRPLSRKQKDWRLTLPYASIKQVTLYLSS